MGEGLKRAFAAAKASRVPLEHQEQSRLFAWADLMAGRHPELRLMFAIPNFSGRLGKVPPVAALRQAAQLKAEGRKKGVPDVFLPAPRGGSHGLFVEMKRQNATASDVAPEQRAWHDALREAGYRVEVCKGWEAARDVILQYLSEPQSAAA